jgi:hypothetical protein
MKRLCLMLPAMLAATTNLALADGAVQKLMTPADSVRLERFEATRKEALEEAHSGDPAASSELDTILAKQSLPLEDFDPVGDWQCRTVKAGGLAKLVIYDWFKCRITDDGSGWKLEKLTGSQRTTGRFYTDSDIRAIYLGSFYVAGQTPAPYGTGPETDQVGYAFRSGADEWRIEFPAPHYESKFDILEFRRHTG